MTEQKKQTIRELIQRGRDLHTAAMEHKATSETLDATFHEIAEKYRLAAQHFADGAKLCSDEVSRLIKNS